MIFLDVFAKKNMSFVFVNNLFLKYFSINVKYHLLDKLEIHLHEK